MKCICEQCGKIYNSVAEALKCEETDKKVKAEEIEKVKKEKERIENLNKNRENDYNAILKKIDEAISMVKKYNDDYNTNFKLDVFINEHKIRNGCIGYNDKLFEDLTFSMMIKNLVKDWI